LRLLKVRLLKQKWHNTNNHNNIGDYRRKYYTENHHHRRSSLFRKKLKKQNSFTQANANTNNLANETLSRSSNMENSRFKRIIRYDYIKNMLGLDKAKTAKSKENYLACMNDDEETSIKFGLLSRTLRACVFRKSVTSNANPNINGQVVEVGVERRREPSVPKSKKHFFDYNSHTVPSSRTGGGGGGFSNYSEHFNSIKDTFRNLKKKVFVYKGYS
jgi:hypothetical protein